MQRPTSGQSNHHIARTSEDHQIRKGARCRRKKVSKHPLAADAKHPCFLHDSSSQQLSISIDHNKEDNLKQSDSTDSGPHCVEAAPETSHCGASSGFLQDEEDSVMRRLNGVCLSHTDLELSEHQYNSNLQDQADEVLALQAIFEEDFVMLEANEGEDQAYMVSIYVEVPSVLDVFVKLPADSRQPSKDTPDEGLRVEANAATEKIRACTLLYLPPLRLIYRPLAYYPSHCPPSFVLSTNWLSENALSKLCKGLDGLWEEQVGDVVIYTWAEWLRTNCLSQLDIFNELVLEVNSECKRHESRVFSGCSSPDMVIPALMRYNEERKNDQFQKSLHTCCICFTEQLGRDFVRLPCAHFFCIECMQQFSRMKVKEGTVKNLFCPDTTCKSSIPPAILKQLLELDEYVRWETLLLQKTLESMADVVYCPRCEAICIEDADHYVQCTVCLFNFCSLCKGARHVGQECMSPEARLRILEARQKGVRSGEDKMRQEQNYVNELLNLKYMKDTAKQCPSCKMAISKVEGCNKVTCGNCGQYFCYRCNKAIEGYEHFREGACVLFDDADVQRWEMAMNAMRAPPVPGEGVALHWRACPNCRQANLKEGNNNHILCWSCQQHFCALCRKMVRRSTDHYGSGPNKCKQHTAD